MSKSALLICFLALFSFALPVRAEIEDRMSLWHSDGAPKLRGTVIRLREVVPDLDRDGDLGPSGIRVGPVYTQADFHAMADAGLNLVVISHPGLYRVRPSYRLDSLLAQHLDKLISYAEAADLFVVLEPRTGPGRSEFTHLLDEAGTWYGDDQLNDRLWGSEAAQNRYVEMIRVTAVRYKRRRPVLGLVTMAAPNSNITGADALNAPLMIDDPSTFDREFAGSLIDWNQLQHRIVRAVRQLDTDVPIIIVPNGEAGPRWLETMTLPDDPRLVIGVRLMGGTDLQRADETSVIDGAELLATVSAPFPALDATARTGTPMFVISTGVHRWLPDADTFMKRRLNGLESRGLSYALSLWQSDWEPFAELRHALAFRFGADPDRRLPVVDAPLMRLYRGFWARNLVRPSQLSRSYR